MDLQCLDVALAALGPARKVSGNEHYFPCNHPENHKNADAHPSLQVNAKKNVFMCAPCNVAGNAWALAGFLAKVSPDNKPAVMAWLREHGLLNGRDERKRVAEYIYTDAKGHPVGKVVRWSPKAFHQERPDGKGGWELGGFPRTLYRLAAILKAQSALIGEGEKDVDAAWEELGIPATTSGNAGSWKPEFAEFLRDKSVCVIAHRDEPGHRHARAVAKSLLGVALRVRLLELPGEGVKDLSDWIEAGGTREQLLQVINRSLELKPEDVAAWEVASPARGNSGSHRTTAIAVMRRASAIEPRAVRWLWPKRIPFGKLTLFAGDPDEGKTAVALDIAARVTTGGEWGDGGRAETCSVIIMTAEDDPDDTLVPRLIAAGADLGRVHFLEASRCITADGKETTRAVTLADIDTIENALSQAGDAKLVIVDPVSAYLSDADSHKNAEVRALLGRPVPLGGYHGSPPRVRAPSRRFICCSLQCAGNPGQLAPFSNFGILTSQPRRRGLEAFQNLRGRSVRRDVGGQFQDRALHSPVEPRCSEGSEVPSECAVTRPESRLDPTESSLNTTQ